MSCSGKTVIVTGGGQGIGRAISRFFATEGAKVVIAEIDSEAGIENEAYIVKEGHTAAFIHTDVSKEDSVKSMVEKTVELFGSIDILINNAAISGFGSMFENSIETWDRVLSVNLRGPFMCSKYCAEVMSKNKGGCIINIASTRAFMSEPDTEAYSASKGGLIALTHSIAISLGKYGIRVNAISPGWIDVSEWKKSSQAKPAVLSQADHSQHPAGRVGTPMDIARACHFLCSEGAGFITGANLMVDGGMTVKMIYV